MKNPSVLVVALALLALGGLGIAHGNPFFSTSMTGAAEVPGPGDPDGSGQASISLSPATGEICFSLTVSDIAPAIAAHIHRGPAGVAGPVVVALTPPTSGSSLGCVIKDKNLVKEIMQHPEQFYVNVHNAQFPAGALRGQLSR